MPYEEINNLIYKNLQLICIFIIMPYIIDNAFRSRDYAGGLSGERSRRSKNDSIYARLDPQFTEDQAMQHSVAIKGAGVTRNSVQQMLKNWRKQGLIEQMENKRFRKLS